MRPSFSMPLVKAVIAVVSVTATTAAASSAQPAPAPVASAPTAPKAPPWAAKYPLPPEATAQAGVPVGEVTKHSWTSAVFPGTARDYWVYVPAGLDRRKPAPVMVFQDGGGYVDPKGPWKVPTVLDNLIHRREIPPLVGIFINPGVLPAAQPHALPRYNRSFEYDGRGDGYVRLLLDEILPEVSKSVVLASDGNSRAIGGASSGAIAAFTAAWRRPDAFTRVLSTIGTYVGLRGGDEYPTLVRKTEPRPIRVFLQDGSADLNIYAGDWWMANQAMLSALKFSGYEVEHAWGEGAHDSWQGAHVLPDALRFLWRGYPTPVAAGKGAKSPASRLVVPGQGWALVSQGHQFTEGPAVDDAGRVSFTDIPGNRIHRIEADGKVGVFAANTGGANGLTFGPDGRLYACQTTRRRIVAYDQRGKETVVATGLSSNDVAITFAGHLYVTDPDHKQVWFIPRKGTGYGPKRVVDTGIAFPNGARLTPDQTMLYVSDSKGRFVYSFQVQADGSLAHKQPYCWLHAPDLPLESGADGMTVDAEGRLYVATAMGVQVCDQTGRVNVILPKPQEGWLANVAFGGAELDTLYVTVQDKVFRRKLNARGVVSWRAPLTPPRPNL